MQLSLQDNPLCLHGGSYDQAYKIHAARLFDTPALACIPANFVYASIQPTGHQRLHPLTEQVVHVELNRRQRVEFEANLYGRVERIGIAGVELKRVGRWLLDTRC